MKKTTLIIDGNTIQTQELEHELRKFVSKANKQPELEVSIQTEKVDESNINLEAAFDGGSYE
jgi:hypothetical protein